MKGFTYPVCGYRALREASRLQGSGGSYEICPACGFQFGVTDMERSCMFFG
jgi:predicted RNA-binding Zn-ribbon protein involved in translation (DUF1610 family)